MEIILLVKNGARFLAPFLNKKLIDKKRVV